MPICGFSKENLAEKRDGIIVRTLPASHLGQLDPGHGFLLWIFCGLQVMRSSFVIKCGLAIYASQLQFADRVQFPAKAEISSKKGNSLFRFLRLARGGTVSI